MGGGLVGDLGTNINGVPVLIVVKNDGLELNGENLEIRYVVIVVLNQGVPI